MRPESEARLTQAVRAELNASSGDAPPIVAKGPYLTGIVDKVVLQKSTPLSIHQLILYYYQYEESVDGFVCKLPL